MDKRGGWKRWTAAVAAKFLAEQRASGLSVAAFARERGLHPNRLYRWRTQLAAQAAASAAEPAFASMVPMRLTDAVASVAAFDGAAPDIELVTAQGCTLSIPVGFDGDTLLRVLDVLAEARPC